MLSSTLAHAVIAWRDLVERTSDADMERDWGWRGVQADVRWGYFRTYENLLALADAIGASRQTAQQPATRAQRALRRYHLAFRELESLLARVKEPEFDRVPAAGEWPLREVLGHVMRADAGFLTVTEWALQRHRAGDDRPLAAPEERFGPRPEQGTGGTLAEVQARFAALHERILSSLANTADAELAAPIGFWYIADVAFQLYRFAAHLREHTIQAETVCEAILPPASDAWRMLRLFYRALGDAEGAALGAEHLAEPLAAQTAAAIRAQREELVSLLGAGA